MAKPNPGLGLFTELPEDADRPVKKSVFALEVGLSKGRISQLVGQGLPVEPNGLIDRAKALEWMERNLDQARRKTNGANGSLSPTKTVTDLRAEHEVVKIDRARLQLAKERGDLVDRVEAERAIFDRARRERDAHLAWIMRAAPLMAAALGVDPGRMFAVLDRAVRDHLDALSRTPLEELDSADDGSMGG